MIIKHYQIESLESKQTDMPINRSRTGYGRKIATSHLVKIPELGTRWRRVYCCIFSNSGTCYVADKQGAWYTIS